MTKDGIPPAPARNETAPRRPLPAAAERALAEAAARRAERERTASRPPEEMAGRGGLEPTRYGDWEIKGIAADF
jgi:hypothetical protein